MSATPSSDSFGARLDLALKSLNISRIQLASLVGVDKSLVGRWLSSQVVPTAHNLARISETLSKHKAGFNAILWQRPLPDFLAFLGVSDLPTATRAPAPTAPAQTSGLHLLSFEMSAREVAANGHVYTGLYVLLRQRFINNGIPVVDLARLYQDGAELRWEIDDGGNRTRGIALLLRNKLHLLGESSGRDGVTLHILNGTGDLHAMVMDGVLASVAGDRFFTPSASKVLLLRIAHKLDDAEADAARFNAATARVNVINNAGQGWKFVPPKYTQVIDNREPLLRENDPAHVLRIGSDEAVAHSDWDVANYDFPVPDLTEAILGA